MTKASEDPGMAAESLKALIELGADACCEHCRRGNWPGHFDNLLAEVERAAAEMAWDRCVGEMPIDPDWKNFYADNNPYRAAALGLTAGQEGEGS